MSLRRLRPLALAPLVLGCQPQDQPDLPNRVLDRPTDIALVCVDCVDTDGDSTCDRLEPQPLEICSNETGSCSSDNPHLVGFVANSERNEIAMFTKCSDRLVDMNVEIPGYNFIPAGILPTDLDASRDGCRVISANVGSCDLSVLDAVGLAGFGVGPAVKSGRPEDLDEPSTLVSTLIPRTFDLDEQRYRPLGARPGEVLSVPIGLTTAPGLNEGQALSGICDPLIKRSAYVSFPTCNLVAELDLQTGNVLQSRQFTTDDLGAITVVDTGVSPSCPVECPALFGEGLPMSPEIDADGPFVQALSLSLEPELSDEGPDPNSSGSSGLSPSEEADAALSGQRLYVGGLGSDVLFEIPIADDGDWESVTKQLELDEAGGIKRIRVSPAVVADIQDAIYAQFLYVVAGDGSTRVVGRPVSEAVDIDILGIECETQLDPNVAPVGAAAACIEVSQSPNEGQPAERRGFSRGPGIRPGRGNEVTDWMFIKVYPDDIPIPGEDVAQAAEPFNEAGTLAVGITTGGFTIYTLINQSRVGGDIASAESLLTGQEVDPQGLMDVRLFPHSLRPDPQLSSLPVVRDDDPGRFIVDGSGPARQLAPTIRRVDATYAYDERAATQLGVEDWDMLGGGATDSEDPLLRLYDEDVVRVAVHDYRSWGGSDWTLEWEATIPGTQSTTGRLDCEKPGWEGGTCLEGARLVDSSANFCDNGVLRGDKLVIVGCFDDDDCGDGRRCLRESAAGGESSGICVSELDYIDRAAELRQICANFISDPCGEAYREFTITRAAQDELWIQSMDQPLISHLVEAPCEDESIVNAVQVGDECRCLPGFSAEACGPAGAGQCCPDPEFVLSGQAPVLEVEDRYVCTDDQPDGSCESDEDCNEGTCIDARCRRPCEDADECVFRRLPGPECFAEFVRYQVALRNSFRVSGPGREFVTDLVEVSPDPNPETGLYECRPAINTDLSRLLTSRLPLPPSDDPDDPEWLAIPACESDTVLPSNANPCRVTAERSQNSLFHVMEYEGQRTVSALRYSNPVFSIVLDLTSLESLTNEVPGYEDSAWPLDLVGYHRSRIPRGYRQSFALDSGYAPFETFLLLEGRPVTYPIRIVESPEPNVAYIVDGSGPGSSTSIRGQVVRVTLGPTVNVDNFFNGVR